MNLGVCPLDSTEYKCAHRHAFTHKHMCMHMCMSCCTCTCAACNVHVCMTPADAVTYISCISRNLPNARRPAGRPRPAIRLYPRAAWRTRRRTDYRLSFIQTP